MCGIAGILRLNASCHIDVQQLHLMADALRHRGPDDAGHHLDDAGRCGLAFRRLSIIDLAHGQQPIFNEDRTVAVVFNGEIYNFRDLRAELTAAGHRFATEVDSEVIVHAYEEFGTDCFTRLAGMFAIAIWDASAGRLLLARDRFGQKPLIYANLRDRLLFGSEMKALLALPDTPRRLDRQSLHRYLLFQYVPAPHAIYADFQKVPPGTYLQFSADQPGRPAVRTYYATPQPPPFLGSYPDARETVGALVTRAVEKRLVADVPLGAFLSGGIDSSIVVAVMRKLGVSPLRTFSIGFPDERYDETIYSRQVAADFGTEHHEHIVTPQAREILDTLAYHYDEPFADSSAIPTFYLSRFTRESVTVALTGDAGDECFAGYDRYRAAQLAARLDRLTPPARRLLGAAGSSLPHGQPKTRTRKLYRFLAALAEPPERRYLAWVNILTPQQLALGYRTEFLESLDFGEPIRWFTALYERAPGEAANRAVYTDLQSYLPYDLLTKVDTASMAASLECRNPFLDHELVEFALSLPLSWRLGRTGKRILKDWSAKYLPTVVRQRPKMGFGVPIGEWFRRDLRDLLTDRLFAPDALVAHVFRPQWLRDFVQAHLSGRANHEHALWALLMLELWRDRWQPGL